MGVRPQGQGVEASPLPFPPVIPSPPSPFLIARTARDCKGLERGRERERGRRGKARGQVSCLWPHRQLSVAIKIQADR